VTALQWLALTALMTGIMALPYVVGRIGAIGLGGAMANPSEELEAKEPLWAGLFNALYCVSLKQRGLTI
jgi:hypothetical protein